MALKDLTAQKSILTEVVIEEIIGPYVRYDTDDKETMLTADGSKLPNKSKVLIYLVALQGWPFVVEEAISTEAKPSDMEKALGIPGGTLRPILKEFKDRHILALRSGKYSVRTATLETIKDELNLSSDGKSPKRAKKKPKKKAAAAKHLNKEKDYNKIGLNKKTSKGKNIQTTGWMTRWIVEGFFNKQRTLANVQQKFHELGMIVPLHNLSGPIKKMVVPALDKPASLKRARAVVDGKTVWVYSVNK